MAEGAETETTAERAARRIAEAAARARAEAAARRAGARDGGPRPPEKGGRDGPDPVRFGDWEVNGRATDF
jgi:hypothetical protein